ncbi:MAG: ribonuclease [Pseudomonadota bacterium]|jgi:ribonuclease G
MFQDILINWAPHETRVAVIEAGAVQEVHLERPLERGIVGNIYLGKVTRVLPGMQSAFIDIGMEKAAFLHVADLFNPASVSKSEGAQDAAVTPIEKQVFEGQTLLVQVIKDPIGTKGARLTTQISIAGRMLVYLPQDRHVGVSQKIAQPLRDALRDRLDRLANEFMGQDRVGGFILRTNAEDATDDDIRKDLRYLQATWENIRQLAQTRAPKSLIHADLNLMQRVLRDMVVEATQSIRIDSREQHQSLLQFARDVMPDTVSLIQHYQGERPIFDLFSVEEEIIRALGRRVPLKSGGYLIIEQTEALTTIDVNTGGFVGRKSFEETIYKTNLEAAGAIARQLRLRNLGGIIVADFIDMQQSEHQQAVLEELKKHLLRDRVKTMVSGFSELGLLELTRKRTRESLMHVMCDACPACKGTGVVKTPRTVVYDILREILREARQFNPRQFRVIASPQVIDLLSEEEGAHLASLGEFIGKPIQLQAEVGMMPDAFEVVLL